VWVRLALRLAVELWGRCRQQAETAPLTSGVEEGRDLGAGVQLQRAKEKGQTRLQIVKEQSAGDASRQILGVYL